MPAIQYIHILAQRCYLVKLFTWVYLSSSDPGTENCCVFLISWTHTHPNTNNTLYYQQTQFVRNCILSDHSHCSFCIVILIISQIVKIITAHGLQSWNKLLFLKIRLYLHFYYLCKGITQMPSDFLFTLDFFFIVSAFMHLFIFSALVPCWVCFFFSFQYTVQRTYEFLELLYINEHSVVHGSNITVFLHKREGTWDIQVIGNILNKV